MDADLLPGIARQVAKFLVEGRYNELARASKGIRLSAEEIEDAISDIGSPLAMPPERVWEELDIVAIRHRPGTFSVQFDLWTARGRSEWTVELTLYSEQGVPVIEVDNIHVR